MIDLMHQGQQLAELARGETLASEPIEVGAGQVGQQAPLVLAERHSPFHQLLEVVGIHRAHFGGKRGGNDTALVSLPRRLACNISMRSAIGS
jgi:hypothetical protein